jgi:MFS family permease
MTKVALGGPRAWFVWCIAVSFVLLVFALQTGYAITNVYVADDLGLTLVQVGLLGSIYTWFFAIAQFASGSILDRIGARRVLPFAAALVTVGAFLFANAPNVWVLLLAQILLALGASFGFIGAGFVGGQWFEPAKYGFMFALVQLFASLAAVAGQNIINIAIQEYHWSYILNALAVGGVIIVLLMLAFLRDPLSKEEAQAQNLVWPGLRNFFTELVDNFNAVASIRDAWVNALIGGATFGSMLALGVVWGPRLMVAAGLDQAVANETISFSWFGLAIGSPVLAWLSDKLKSRKKPMAAALVLQVLVIVVVLFSPERSAGEFSVLFFIWGFAAGGSMIAFTIGMELADKALVGTSAAMVNATQFIAAGVLMAIPGRVLAGSGLIARVANIESQAAETLENYQWALIVYPLVLLFALFLFLFLKETYSEAE